MAVTEKKDFIIRVRVTQAEQERFKQQAKEQGYKTVSAYIRSLIGEGKRDTENQSPPSLHRYAPDRYAKSTDE